MATINFHLRKYYYYPEGGGSPTTEVPYWSTEVDGDGNTIFKCDSVFTNSSMGEIYVLAPKIATTFSAPYNGPSWNPATSNTFAHFRISNQTVSIYYPYNLFVCGDMNFSQANTLVLCKTINAIYTPYYSNVFTSNSNWSTAGYTPGTYNTFKNEITGYLAAAINNSRSLEGASISPNSHYDDFAVQLFMNQIDGTYHFVTFYPGNDPNADETIAEVV